MIPIAADLLEFMTDKIEKDKENISAMFSKKENIVKTLLTICNSAKMMVESCHSLAPYHAQGFESIIKATFYLFEIVLRSHSMSLTQKLEK